MHEAGFTKVTVDQNCPECGRFRKLIPRAPCWYCATCDKFEDMEKMVKLYVCGTCHAVRRETNLEK